MTPPVAEPATGRLAGLIFASPGLYCGVMPVAARPLNAFPLAAARGADA